jgi:PAS domain S-box-containing protein
MTCRILVVEDSPTQAERIRLLLEGAGYQADVARNGRDALRQIATAPPDLVISDIAMPEMDGYALCQEVKSDRATKHIPVVLLTERKSPLDIIEGMMRGADNFLTKPFEDPYLLERVRRIFEHLDLRRHGTLEVEIVLRLGGRDISFSADKQQIFELLFATFEELSLANTCLRERERTLDAKARELEVGNRTLAEQVLERTRAEEALRRARDELERRVQERTAELTQANAALREEVVERLRTEAAVQESEARYRSLFDDAPVGYHELDTQGRIVRVNRTELSMLGYTAEEMFERSVWEFMAEGDVSRQAIQTKLAGKQPAVTFECKYISKDGRRLPVLVEDRILRDSEGRITGIRSTIQDITERKRTEEQIKSQLEELQRWQDVMLGREDRVQELKREINELCRRIGETARYPSQKAGSADSEIDSQNESRQR